MVYRKATDFCIQILYIVTLLKLLSNLSSLGSFSTDRDNLNSPVPIYIPLIVVLA